MNSIEDLNLASKRVLVRLDLNVPLDSEGHVTDNTRILGALPTIKHLLNSDCKVVLMSHLGRPKGERKKEFSLSQIVSDLAEALKTTVQFSSDCIGEEARNLSHSLKDGEVLLLENLRYHSEETSGDEEFAKQLSELADVYINDAFGTAHRNHASTAVIAQYFDSDSKAMGFLMNTEMEASKRLLTNPEKDFVAITGGAKVSDKILILDNLIGRADHIIIGGGMAFTFLKAKGGTIGKSLCEDDRMELALELMQKAEKLGTKLHLPSDVVAADDFAPDANTKICNSSSIDSSYMGLDIGPQSILAFTELIKSSKSILWNGPMGVFEMEAFAKGTKSVAEAVADATDKGAYSLIGGGDSAAAVNQFGFQNRVSHVSTGGGALLELFEGKILPGIAALSV